LSESAKLQWLGTLRARAGVTFDRWLVYGTGGLAYGGVKVDAAATATGAPSAIFFAATCLPNGCPFLPFGAGSSSRTRLGWTVGAGIEGALAGNWTVKLEYLHVDLGSVDTTFATLPICAGNVVAAVGCCINLLPGTAAIRTRVTDEIVRVGLNYRFGDPAVVARN
jgi:outer membrane immunogenic protein